jgi:enoyl-CoA hydratase/carnithine racemase
MLVLHQAIKLSTGFIQFSILLILVSVGLACQSTPQPTVPMTRTLPQYTDYTALHVAVDAGVAHVTIDHPPLNILDAVLMTELNRFAGAVRTDKQVRVIVFQSADPDFFIAHGDMNFVNNPDSFTQLVLGDEAGAALNPMQKLHERFRTLPQVTIAKLAGLARGGGSEFVMALDMRFAAIGKAGLGQFEVLTGIIPGAGGTVYLPRLIGRARAMEVILGAALVDAKTAERYGWVNRALAANELDGFVDALARRIGALPPGVVLATKAAIDAADQPIAAALREENVLLGRVFTAPAAVEQTRAALAAGAQTRVGERDLEGLLNGLLTRQHR